MIDEEQKQLYVDMTSLKEACLHLLKEEKAELASQTSELSQQIRPQSKNDSPFRSISRQQRINRGQPKVGIKDQVCASCGITGHAVRHCVKQELDGFVHGCPRCNTREHAFDNCTYQGCGDLYFLVRLRDGQPPIRTEKDYRDIIGFEKLSERPWTPEFSRKHLNHHKSYDYTAKYFEKCQIPDPAWLDENKIPAGSLAYSATPGVLRDAPHMLPRPTANGITSIVEEILRLKDYDLECNVVPTTARTLKSDCNDIERPLPKLRKIDTGRKRFWTACFRGVELS